MKTSLLLVVALGTFAAGCGHKDEAVIAGPDGSKTVISNSGANQTFEATDKNGTKVTETIGGNKFTATDNKGNSTSVGAGTVQESDLAGLTFYPGSTEAAGGLNGVSEDPTAKSAVSTRTTKDDPGKVSDYYKDKIPGAQTSSTKANGTTMISVSGKLSGGEEVGVLATNDGKSDTSIVLTVKAPKK